MFAAAVAAITGVKVLGETMIRPPASRTRATSAGSSTVPARRGAVAGGPRRISMLLSGSGELSGTSMMRMPAS